ncbi:unnamed protein product [Orchesella dallaii]|uniref:SCP domain-containing protein n=1 Tax=Orchesella dallaii TaxID=48710 RepID=A0ABP1PLB4_9HEXA
MARFALAVFCIAALAATSSAMTFTEYGIDTACTAYDAVCWYETLKNFPKTNSKGFGKCGTTCSQMKSQVMKYDEPKQKEYFGKFLAQHGFGSIPSQYSTCESVLISGATETSDDESDALRDGKQEYPFRAFAYCMMKALRSKHGDKAIEAVKAEKTHSKKHWMETLLTRDNEFRALHGSPPLKRISPLNKAAQEWADKNAAECNSKHSDRDAAIRQWNGKGTGESLSAGGGPDAPEDAAYIASDGWYEEISLYPFPAGIKDANDPRFHDVGHFTQTVWKASEYVGYGYAYNPNCSPFTHYITARYSVAGNLAGAFQENVVPPL